MFICICVCVCVCLCIYIYIYTYIHMYLCVYIYIYICLNRTRLLAGLQVRPRGLANTIYVCTYVCIYIYIYIHIYPTCYVLSYYSFLSFYGVSLFIIFVISCWLDFRCYLESRSYVVICMCYVIMCVSFDNILFIHHYVLCMFVFNVLIYSGAT